MAVDLDGLLALTRGVIEQTGLGPSEAARHVMAVTQPEPEVLSHLAEVGLAKIVADRLHAGRGGSRPGLVGVIDPLADPTADSHGVFRSRLDWKVEDWHAYAVLCEAQAAGLQAKATAAREVIRILQDAKVRTAAELPEDRLAEVRQIVKIYG